MGLWRREHKMTQRIIAHICIWIMILAGILFLTNIFVVPYFASLFAGTSVQLPIVVKFILNLSNFMVYHGWVFSSFYITLFIAVIVWYCKTKPQANTGR